MFTLVSTLISVALVYADAYLLGFSAETEAPTPIGGYGPLGWAWGLAALVPTLSVTVRRLHDIGFTGWWLALAAPVAIARLPWPGPLVMVGFIVAMVGLLTTVILLIMLVSDGEAEPNRWGANPKSAVEGDPPG